mgnify:CR=1 FL=1
MNKKKKEERTDREKLMDFLNQFCGEIHGHNTAWEGMINHLTDEELHKFARLWAPAVEYAMSRMEIYRLHERWD